MRPRLGITVEIPEEGNRMSDAKRQLIGFGIALALLGVVTVGTLSSRAQDATPVSGDQPAQAGTELPAHIHAGNCETLDPNPLQPLASIMFTNVEAADADTPATPDAGMASPAAAATPVTDGSPPAASTSMGSAMAIEGGHSTTNVPLPLADILGAEHAINVHLSPEQPEVYVACGAIGGEPDENGDLFIGLREQNGSGISGIAWLHDNGDGASTTVTVMLASQLSEASVDGDAATPDAATPAA
jgi:hypothetical protein